MKVEYTLPGLQPEAVSEADAPIESDVSFRGKLRSLRAEVPVRWEQHLGLDARPVTASYIGPPPRPRTLELNDVETDRLRWRQMLVRHSEGMNPPPASGRMLALLSEMQEMEDSILTRHLALTRG